MQARVPVPPRRRARRPIRAVSVLLLTLAGCGGRAGPGGTPTPDFEDVVQPIPPATVPPSATPTATLAPEAALATLAALLPSATAGASAAADPVLGLPPPAVPEPGCAIPRGAPSYRLVPAPEAPEALRAEWAAGGDRSLEAELLSHDPGARLYALRAIEPAPDQAFILVYDGAPLPIETGRRYRFRLHADPPAAEPAGSALRIDDEAGLVFLGVSVRETAGASARIFGGDRAGFELQQLPTRCRYVESDGCGFELRAAPLEIAHPEGGALRANAGEGAELSAPGGRYRVDVLTSHFRRWLSDMPCADPSDWVLAYRIARQSVEAPAP